LGGSKDHAIAPADDESPDDDVIDVRPQRTLGLGGLLFELLLPTAFSAAVLLTGAGWAPSWNLRSRLGLGIFAVLLVLLAAVASLRLDSFTRARRRERGRSQILNRATSFRSWPSPPPRASSCRTTRRRWIRP